MAEPATTHVPDLSKYRRDFPILERDLSGRQLIYLDSAATSLKPQAVIDAVTGFYTRYTSNIHRAVHALSEEATEAFEDARATVARFLNADIREVAFTRNATEALNVVSHSLRDRGPVVMPLSEHHSNLVPWRAGNSVVLKAMPDGQVDIEAARRTIAETKPALVAMSTVSNGLGITLPVAELTAAARDAGAMVLLDVSQSCGHEPVDVVELDCDFACFSGHKMLAPSGIGVLYQREGLEHSLEPLLIGGAMVHEVHVEDHTFRPFPWCMEAGTPNIEGAIGLAAACDYLDAIGLDVVQSHCRHLTSMVRAQLEALPQVDVHVSGPSASDSMVTFSSKSVAAHGVARMLSNRFGIMVRSGYHCAQPVYESCGIPESVRASVHLYNTAEEMDSLVEAVSVVSKMA